MWQIIFTASCAFILEGVDKGMGRHNDAITNDDDKVLALMVCTHIYELCNITYTDNFTVASPCDDNLHHGHDVHQAQHWSLFIATIRSTEGLYLHSAVQSCCYYSLEPWSVPLGYLPMHSR